MAVQRAAWEAGLASLLGEVVDLPDAAAVRLRLLEMLDSKEASITLALVGGAARGFVSFGSSRDEDAGPDVGEVRSLFVHPTSWGAGVGDALLAHAIRELRIAARRQATLWSLAQNARANAFYARHGFERDGAEQRRKPFGGALETRYRRRLE